jgi:hypothetical protein
MQSSTHVVSTQSFLGAHGVEMRLHGGRRALVLF